MLFGEVEQIGALRGEQAAATPGTTFTYSTGTSMILARVIGDIVAAADGTAWARSAVFDRLGSRR